METVEESYRGIAHYRPLGLLANPFSLGKWGEPSWIPSAAESEGHHLVSRLMAADTAGDARPMWVSEPDIIDEDFFMQAISKAEMMFANDPELDVLHAYVPLPAMRIGSVRAILGVVAERLVFREFGETLAAYVRDVLAAPDDSLASYKVLGPERLVSYASEFEAAPGAAAEAVFGGEELERQEEMSEALDDRQVDAEQLGDDEDESGELDDSIGVAPGVREESAAERAGSEADGADTDGPVDLYPKVLDYLIEYAAVHYSPVVARALRTYSERGLVAAAAEFKVTKAPSKTLAAVVAFSRLRFDRVVILLSEFGYWKDVPDHLRHKIVGALTALRWSLGDGARLVVLARPGEAPELEETFGAGLRLEWGFGAFRNPPALDSAVVPELVDGWLANAGVPGSDPLTTSGGGLAELIERVGSDFERFIVAARAAVDDAAARGVGSIDSPAVAAGLQALEQSADAANA